MTDMTQLKAEGFLVTHAINDLFRSHDEDFGGCCRINCGPCAALDWLREHNPVWADDAVRANWDGRAEARYDWQIEDGGIDWPQLVAEWDSHKGCARSNGVWQSCNFEQQSEELPPEIGARVDRALADPDSWVTCERPRRSEGPA